MYMFYVLLYMYMYSLCVQVAAYIQERKEFLAHQEKDIPSDMQRMRQLQRENNEVRAEDTHEIFTVANSNTWIHFKTRFSRTTFSYTPLISPMLFSTRCVTLRGRIKEAACTLRKQDPALPENRALNKCEACFNWV